MGLKCEHCGTEIKKSRELPNKRVYVTCENKKCKMFSKEIQHGKSPKPKEDPKPETKPETDPKEAPPQAAQSGKGKGKKK